MTSIFAVLASKAAAVLSNTALLYLILSAEVNTAPEELPSFSGFAQWLWGWQVHAGRLFLNMKNATPQLPPGTQTTTQTDIHQVAKQVTPPNEQTQEKKT